jgi:hypothetical protein
VIKGQVSGFQTRFESAGRGPGTTVWSFRLDRHDKEGKPLPRVAVEMRGTSFDGAINQGDWVELDQDWKPGTTLRAKRLTNLTTNAVVSSKGAAIKAFSKALVVVFFVVFLVVAFVIIKTATSIL